VSSEDTRRLAGRVVVVTGAGRGIGAEYARQAAAAGAKVVVNDLGRGLHGEGEATGSPAEQVVAEIVAAGGEAVADHHDVADFAGAGALIQRALDAFGDLDVLVNNAGILRDRMLVSMSETEFDEVLRVHLRGHFCTSRHAAEYWRTRSREQGPRDAVLIQTTSIAGLHGNVGQVNYAAAKAGIASMAATAHLELNQRYGVRSYAIAPGARTRLTLSSPGAVDAVAAPTDGSFDFYGAENVAPFVLWLAADGCAAPSGTVYGVEGDLVRRYQPWTIAATIANGGRWTFDELDSRSAELHDGIEPIIGSPLVIGLTEEHVARLRQGAPA
jgi:NAD(P)-dependent dehydrogenase (short-subunit alcohol dehydrogenase family)